MSKFKVFLDVTTRIMVGVAADDADMAVYRVRQRVEKDLTDDQKIGEFNAEATEEAEGKSGRVLTAEELAYCNGRFYGIGHDTDAFDGLQWSHLVDDSIAICRTRELWMSAPGLRTGCEKDGEVRISCAFCLATLEREMIYDGLWLKHHSRRNGARAAAKIEYLGDGEHALLVNDIVVIKSRLDQDHLHQLAEKINGGGPWPWRNSNGEGLAPVIERGPIEVGTSQESMLAAHQAREEALYDALSEARRACGQLKDDEVVSPCIDRIKALIEAVKES